MVSEQRCRACGQATPAGAAFCNHCGARLGPAAGRPPIPRYLLVLGAGLFFGLCGLCTLVEFLVSVPHPLVLAIAAPLPILPAAFYTLLVIGVDRYEREPLGALAATFLWGALVAVALAWLINTMLSALAGAALGPAAGRVLAAAFGGPVVEETAKGLVLLLLFWLYRREFDDLLDGIVYGSLCGIGFAMTENVLYFSRSLLQGGVGGLALVFVLRDLLGGLSGHPAYTATTGIGLGLARESRSPAVQLLAPVAGWTLAVVQHAFWNGVVATLLPRLIGPWTLLVMLVYPLPLLTAFGVTIFLLLRREGRILRTYLRDEVASGVVTAEEYARLGSLGGRLKAEWTALSQRGLAAWRAMVQLHDAATELAFRKWQSARGVPISDAAAAEAVCKRRIAEARTALRAHGL
ncbi:MAG TPA: PrsW family glutamic-type intramembrane protease [Chloroflexota bacterium]|nr:PrsW family glutamic-type intramembrane protease [Chloroflexota bacterium]